MCTLTLSEADWASDRKSPEITSRKSTSPVNTAATTGLLVWNLLHVHPVVVGELSACPVARLLSPGHVVLVAVQNYLIAGSQLMNLYGPEAMNSCASSGEGYFAAVSLGIILG